MKGIVHVDNYIETDRVISPLKNRNGKCIKCVNVVALTINYRHIIITTDDHPFDDEDKFNKSISIITCEDQIKFLDGFNNLSNLFFSSSSPTSVIGD